MTEANSNSQSKIFRSYSVIFIVLTCIGGFLVFTDQLSEKAEVIAKDRVISDIRKSLAMMLYDYTIKSKQHELQYFHHENPFIPLAIYKGLPVNYRGAVSVFPAFPLQGWYFDLSLRQAVFVSSQSELEKFTVIFQYEDTNLNSRFDYGVDVIQGFSMKKAS